MFYLSIEELEKEIEVNVSALKKSLSAADLKRKPDGEKLAKVPQVMREHMMAAAVATFKKWKKFPSETKQVLTHPSNWVVDFTPLHPNEFGPQATSKWCQGVLCRDHLGN